MTDSMRAQMPACACNHKYVNIIPRCLFIRVWTCHIVSKIQWTRNSKLEHLSLFSLLKVSHIIYHVQWNITYSMCTQIKIANTFSKMTAFSAKFDWMQSRERDWLNGFWFNALCRFTARKRVIVINNFHPKVLKTTISNRIPSRCRGFVALRAGIFSVSTAFAFAANSFIRIHT